MTGGRRRIAGAALTIAAMVSSAVFVFPLLWLAASAFRPSAETFGASKGISVLWPRTFTFDNFVAAFSKGFSQNLANSLMVAALTVVFGLAVSVAAGFALAVIDFPGRTVVFALTVVAFMIPFEMVAVPLATAFNEVGLRNNMAALVIPGIAHGLAIFNLRQFFRGVPTELVDAARIDGAGWLRILSSIYLPLSKPALIGSGMILAIAQWNAYLWPSLIISDDSRTTAQIAIGLNTTPYSQDFGASFAQVLLISAVPAVLILLLQRWLVQSIASTGSR